MSAHPFRDSAACLGRQWECQKCRGSIPISNPAHIPSAPRGTPLEAALSKRWHTTNSQQQMLPEKCRKELAEGFHGRCHPWNCLSMDQLFLQKLLCVPQEHGLAAEFPEPSGASGRSPATEESSFILQLHKSRGFACCVFPLPQQLSLIPPKNSHSFPRKTHRPPALTFPPCPQHQSSVNSPGQGHPTVTGPKDL